MATNLPTNANIAGVVQRNEPKSARTEIPVNVGTDEAQTVTRQKPSEASFQASNSTASKLVSNLYSLAIDAADIDELGITWFYLSGATDDTYIAVMVVEFDPYSEGAMSDLLLKHRAATPA